MCSKWSSEKDFRNEKVCINDKDQTCSRRRFLLSGRTAPLNYNQIFVNCVSTINLHGNMLIT